MNNVIYNIFIRGKKRKCYLFRKNKKENSSMKSIEKKKVKKTISIV